MVAQSQARLTPEEYLKIERAAPFKSELNAGGIESDCRFESVGVTIPLAQIYDKVVFQKDAAPPLPSN